MPIRGEPAKRSRPAGPTTPSPPLRQCGCGPVKVVQRPRLNPASARTTLALCTWWPARIAGCSVCCRSRWASPRPTSGRRFTSDCAPTSLALISEAGHNVSDLLAIALSFVAVYFQARPANDHKTFGYQRAGVLAAFLNASMLVVLSAWIAIAAVHRLSAPVEVQPKLMMIVAAAGVLMNGTVATLLWRTSHTPGGGSDVNIRSVLPAHARRHAFDGGYDCRRRGDSVHRPRLDRSCALDSDRRDDFVEFDLDRARDAEYSAGRNAAQPAPGRGSHGHAVGCRRARRP